VLSVSDILRDMSLHGLALHLTSSCHSVHRIGRTGRCGKTGIATTFINKNCGESLSNPPLSPQSFMQMIVNPCVHIHR
jgi:hypothetical protein